MRLYIVTDEETGMVYEFTNYRKAGRYFRKLRHNLHYATARTVDETGMRLDSIDGTPEWAWNPDFVYSRRR